MARTRADAGRKAQKGERGQGSKGQPRSSKAKERAEGSKFNRQQMIASRCSVGVIRTTMEGLQDRMTERQREAIKATPFYHLGKVGMGNMSLKMLKAVVESYNPIKQAFEIGDGVSIPFTEWEFSVVLGLQSRGHYIHPMCKPRSQIVEKYFDGHYAWVVRSRIVELLGQLAGTKSVGDFARMYVLLVFNAVLFPDSNAHTPGFVISYVDNLGCINEFAWGKAVYTFLVSSIRRHLREMTQHLDGCTLGLMGWFYERVPMLAKPRWHLRVPRFSRWVEMHGDYQACRARLQAIIDDDVVELVLLTGEEKYVRVVRSPPKTTPSVNVKGASQVAQDDDGRGAELSEFENDPSVSETEEEEVEVDRRRSGRNRSRARKKARVEEEESVGGTVDESRDVVEEEVDDEEEEEEEAVHVSSPPRRASARKDMGQQRTKRREDTLAPSSIARTVRARTRTIKGKDPGFITPVSSPKRVRKRRQAPTIQLKTEVGKQREKVAVQQSPKEASEQAPKVAAAESEPEGQAAKTEEPFWPVVSYTSNRGRGVVEADFMEPTHNKQDFEKTPVFQKLEARLKDMTNEYWDYHCGLIGYSFTRIKPPSTMLTHSVSKSYANASSAVGASRLHGSSDSLPSFPQTSQGAPFKRKELHSPMESKRVRMGVEGPGIIGSAPGGVVQGADALSGQSQSREAANLIRQNKKLRARYLEYEKADEELHLKFSRLAAQVEEAKQEYAELLLQIQVK